MINAMCLENAWCLFYTILHIFGYTMDALFNGLLAELPTILDTFTNITSDYIDVVGREWWGAMEVAG